MIKWNRTYTLLSAVIVLLLALIWYYGQLYLLEPARESIAESKETLAGHQALFDLADSGQLSREDLEAEVEATRVRLPSEKTVDEIVRVLDEIENRTDVIIGQISLSNDSINTEQTYYPSGVSHIRYQLNFSAESFADFEQFIRELNNQERIVELNQLSIQQTSTDGVSGSVAVRYYYNDNVNLD